MPSGLPARLAVVCILVVGVSIAHAERRPVAVIDLAGNQETKRLADQLHRQLLTHAELQPIPDLLIPQELYGEFRDDDADRISNAQTAKQTAEQELARFDFRIAEQNASNGLEELSHVTPNTNALALYAQLAFVRGQALLGIPARAREAPAAFALAHRLDPSFVPDPARYLPDVVRAFEAAKRAWTGKGTLGVGGTGRLWIDGNDHGLSPADVEVDAGPHVVWLTGANRMTTARVVTVAAGKRERVAIPDEPADLRTKVRRARAQLRNAPDPAARAASMSALADLVGVRDAVLLTSANKKVIVQTWNAGTRQQTPGFSALRELKSEKPVELLAPLAAPKKVVEEFPPTQNKPIVVDKRWYERRPVQAGIIVGVVALVIAGYYTYAALTDDDFLLNEDAQVEIPQGLGVRW
jgi:hypothetical protein